MLLMLLRLALAACACPVTCAARMRRPPRKPVFAALPVRSRRACRIAWGEIRARYRAKDMMVPA